MDLLLSMKEKYDSSLQLMEQRMVSIEDAKFAQAMQAQLDAEELAQETDEGFNLSDANRPTNDGTASSASSTSDPGPGKASQRKAKQKEAQKRQAEKLAASSEKKNESIPAVSTPAAAKPKNPSSLNARLMSKNRSPRETAPPLEPDSESEDDQTKQLDRFRQELLHGTLRTHTAFNGKPLTSPYDIHTLVLKRKEMYEFESQHRCKVYWDDVVEYKLKKQTMRKYAPGEDVRCFAMKDFETIWKWLLANIEPKNEVEFSRILSSYQPSPEYCKQRLSSSTFEREWLDLTIDHIDGFVEILDALMLCAPDFCPATWSNAKNPAGGFDRKSLTNIFLNTFPQGVGKGIHSLLPYQEEKRGSFKAYVKEIKDQLDAEVEICRQSDKQRRFFKDVYESAHGKSSTDKTLANIEGDPYYLPDALMDYDQEQLLAMTSSKSAEANLPQGCFKVIEKGPNGCPDGFKCKYSHKQEDLERTCDWMIAHHKKKLEFLTSRPYRSAHAAKFASKNAGPKLLALTTSEDRQGMVKTHQEAEPDSEEDFLDPSPDSDNA